MWDDIYKPNSIGSEGGTIIADEEYKESCRITLERCERYDAITCGVYGCMMHSVKCPSISVMSSFAVACIVSRDAFNSVISLPLLHPATYPKE